MIPSTTVLLFALAIGLLTAAATAVRSVSWIWLRKWAEREVSAAGDGVQPTLDRPQRYLLAAGTGIASLAFALGATIGFGEDRDRLALTLVAAVVVVLVVGQVVPRMIARRWAMSLIPALMPVLRLLDAVVGPILAFAARTVRPLVRRVGPGGDAPSPLQDLLREAEVEGLGEAAEVEIISGVVEFGGKRVREAMMPRQQVTVVHETQDAAAVDQVVAQSKFTRIPVVAADGSTVRGVVNAFDVLANPADPLGSLRPAAEASADETCGVVMRRLLRERRHLAVVRDGDAAFVGIVTLEDLVEELVGDIRDEHDEPAGAS